MRFWDASAIVPLLVFEASSRALQALPKQDPTMLVWWGSEVECASAVARIERDGALDPRNAGQAFDRLRQLSRVWHEVEPSDPIRQIAVRFLRVHPLRAADALQLAAAYAAAEHRPTSLDVVTLDERLAVAASKEGFPVLDTQSLPTS
jgi:predicted nucleic acid-binding protein